LPDLPADAADLPAAADADADPAAGDPPVEAPDGHA
jgi:hypothetical protein